MSTVNGFQVGANVLKYSAEALENYNTPDYSSSSTYAVGEYVMYQGKLYKCKTAITTAEAWTAAHWETAILSEDVSDLKSQTMQYYDISSLDTFDAKTSLPLNRYTLGTYTKLLPTFSDTDPPDIPFSSSNNIRVSKRSSARSTTDFILEFDNLSTKRHFYLYVVGGTTYRWVVPDTTLSRKADSADAKATGDAIAGAKAEAITNEVTYDKSRNKYNPNNPLTQSGYWNDSQLKPSTSARVTHPIYVLKGVEYKQNLDTSFLGNNSNITKVDASGNRISSFTGTIDGGVLTFIPAFTGYVSLNMGKFSDDVFRVAESAQYPTYGQAYTPAIAIEANPLIGKKLSVNGDSICAGAGYTGGYAKIIGLRNNMEVQNIGVNGATITSGTQMSGEDRHWISTSIGDMDSDADYVILEGGINDDADIIGAGNIGEINPVDYTGPFDTTKFCGALDYMFSQAWSRFPDKKIGFIIVHKAVQKFNSSTTYSDNRYPFVVQACKKWGIPYLDLNSETPPLNYISALKSAYTKDGDGWHPNEEGYKLFYVPKIEAWMKTL